MHPAIDTSNLTFIAGNEPVAVLGMERRPRPDQPTGAVLRAPDAVTLGAEDGAAVLPIRGAGESGHPCRAAAARG